MLGHQSFAMVVASLLILGGFFGDICEILGSLSCCL